MVTLRTDKLGRPRKASSAAWGKVRKLRSGRLQASYVGNDGKRHNAPTTFVKPKEARDWLTEQHAQLLKSAPPAPVAPAQPIAFGVYALDEVGRRDLTPRTRADYQSYLSRFILPRWEAIAISDITREAVRTWYADLCPDCPTQRKHVYGLFRSIMISAVKDELIAQNPAAPRSGKKRRSEIVIATPEQIELIASGMPPKERLAVYLASWGGLRSGEIRELRRDDIVIADGHAVVRVRRGVTRVNGVFVIGPPKTAAGVRDVTLPPHLTEAVVAHLTVFTGAGGDALLFPNQAGTTLSDTTLRKHYAKARAAAGRPDLRFHDLRHTGLTLAARCGATLAELMARAGHETPSAAMIYQHAAAERDRALADKMSELAAAG